MTSTRGLISVSRVAMRSPAALSTSRRFLSMSKTYQLVLVRHGESTWNDENKFTGWYDCPLSKKGEEEAMNAGKLLKNEGFKFDLAYTSYLQRAIKTLWHSLEQTGHMYIPIKNAWELNERCATRSSTPLPPPLSLVVTVFGLFLN